jgi:hypothetical protein
MSSFGDCDDSDDISLIIRGQFTEGQRALLSPPAPLIRAFELYASTPVGFKKIAGAPVTP